MSDKPPVEVTTPVYGGVSVENPGIIRAIKECKKNGISKEQAAKVIGMPMEVIEKHYK